MTVLFDRAWQVSVDTLDVSENDIDFKIEKSTAREPNTAEVRIWNLSPEHRALIETAEHPRVVVRAGYRADGAPPPILFSGDGRRQWTEREGPDFISVIEARDSGRSYNQARISRSYSPDTPVRSVLTDLVDALGVGRGNLDDFVSALTLSNGSDSFSDGFVSDGPVRRVLQSLVRGARLRWSIQNGSFQVQRLGQPLQARAVVIAADAGMVDSPTRDERGKVTAKILIQTGLEPGRKVKVESSVIEGSYEIRKVSYHGNTRDNDWYATLEMRSVSA